MGKLARVRTLEEKKFLRCVQEDNEQCTRLAFEGSRGGGGEGQCIVAGKKHGASRRCTVWLRTY